MFGTFIDCFFLIWLCAPQFPIWMNSHVDEYTFLLLFKGIFMHPGLTV